MLNLLKLFSFFFLLPLLSNSLTINNMEIRDLEDKTSYLETEAAPWVITNNLGTAKTTVCGTGNPYLLGGIGVNGASATFQRTYNSLPTHSLVLFSITFWVIDAVGSDTLFKMFFNNVEVGTWYTAGLTGNTASFSCGALLLAEFPSITIKGQVAHTASSLVLKIQSMIASSSTFGFRDLNLIFSTTSATTSVCKFSFSPGSSSCFCASNQYGGTSGFAGCADCHTSCATCIGPNANQCTSCPAGSSFISGSCVTCHPTCDQCTGTAATQCLRCPSGKYFYWNHTCQNDCDFPLVNTNQGQNKYCNTPCPTNDFYYPSDGSCSTSCGSSYVQSQVDVVKLCSLPCTSTEYLYKGTTCRTNCDYPLKKVLGPVNHCVLPCDSGEYHYWNDTCHDDCVSPLVKGKDGDVDTCSLPCTLGDFFYNGTTCQTGCLDPLKQVIQGDLKLCKLPCDGNKFHYWDNTCQNNCDSPLVQGMDGDVKTCSLPCPSGEFFYRNTTCQTDCLSPLKKVITGDLKVCNLPCDINKFHYWDDSCNNDCDLPLVKGTDGDVKTCSLPCPNGEFFYRGTTCQTDCNSPLKKVITGDLKVCNLPCDINKFHYWDDSCNDDCDDPLVKGTNGDVKTCSLPCPIGQFWYKNTVCRTGCLSPLKQVINGDLKLCNLPCDISEYWSYKNVCETDCDDPLVKGTNGDVKTCSLPCGTNQYIDLNNTCTPSCDFPFIKVTNGDLKYCDSPCTTSEFLYWDKSCRTSCPAVFRRNLGGGKIYCEPHCDSGTFLYWNNTCKTACDLPLKQGFNSDTEQSSCQKPCADSEYYYQNDTCYKTCNSPYKSVTTVDGARLCNVPCGPNDFWSLDDKTCVSSCDSPNIQAESGVLKTCKKGSSAVAETTKAVSDVGGSTAVGAAVSMSLLNAGNPSALFALSLAQLLKYIKYINLQYPDNVEQLFSGSGFELPALPMSIDDKILPYFENQLNYTSNTSSLAIFNKRNLHSSFFVNFYELSKLLLIFLLIIGSLWPIELLLKKWKSERGEKVFCHFQKVKIGLRWNLFLLLFFTTYEDISLYFCVEVSTFTASSFAAIFSLLFCLFCTFIGIFVLWKTFSTCKHFSKLPIEPISPKAVSRLDTLNEKWAACKIFYEEYKRATFWKTGFIFFFNLRIVACFFIIGFLRNHQIVQAVLITLISFLMLFYLITLRPMKEKFNMIENMTYEIIISLVNVCVTLYALQEKLEWDKPQLRQVLGDIIATANLTIGIATATFPMLSLLLWIFNAVHGWIKARKSLKVEPIPVLSPTSEPVLQSKRKGSLQDVVRKSIKRASLALGISNFGKIENELFIAKGDKKIQGQLHLANPEAILKGMALVDEEDTTRWIRSPRTGGESPITGMYSPDTAAEFSWKTADIKKELRRERVKERAKETPTSSSNQFDISSLMYRENTKEGFTVLNVQDLMVTQDVTNPRFGFDEGTSILNDMSPNNKLKQIQNLQNDPLRYNKTIRRIRRRVKESQHLNSSRENLNTQSVSISVAEEQPKGDKSQIEKVESNLHITFNCLE